MASRGVAVVAAMAAWVGASAAVAVAAAPATQPAATRPASFKMFEAMSYVGQPPLGRYGIERVVLVDRGLWARTATGFDESEPDEKACRATAWWAARTGAPVVLDIEHWPVDVRSTPEREARANLEKLARVVDWMHAERPGMKVGYYGIIPLRDYWTPEKLWMAGRAGRAGAKDAEAARAEYEKWRKANDLVREYLGKRVDFVCPSLYTFYEDRDGWVRFAEANLAEARRAGKPVYPFLWMDYHESQKDRAGKTLPGDYWRTELETCRRLADGVVLWGGWKFPPGRPGYRAPWNPSAGWWVETERFMEEGDASTVRTEASQSSR